MAGCISAVVDKALSDSESLDGLSWGAGDSGYVSACVCRSELLTAEVR